MQSGAEMAPSKPPNILFFFPDQWRGDWLGLPGMLPIRTPNLRRLAATGAWFERAITPSPLCAPARACLAAGVEYDRCRTPNNGVDFPLDQPNFYRALRESGYFVMGCGKFDLAKALHDWGGDGKRRLPEWGFSDGIDSEGKWDAVNSGRVRPKGPYMNFLEARGLREVHIRDFEARRRVGAQAVFATPLPDDAYGDNWVGANGLELLDRAPAGRPWFLQVNFPGPHAPWDITRSMERRCRGLGGLPGPIESGQFTPEIHLRIRQNYSAMVENIDRWLGIYLERLRDRGQLENTLVVFSSDHGEMLGDHGRWGKSVPYHPAVQVPLFIAGPGIVPGLRIESPVTILDLAATFLDFGRAPELPGMDSRSLRPLLAGETRDGPRRTVRSGLMGWRLAWDGRWKLVRGFARDASETAGGTLLLFDLENDPGETRNLAGRSEFREQVRRLARELPPGIGAAG